jgi:drug/metabolite transporter (DMT)-like permease
VGPNVILFPQPQTLTYHEQATTSATTAIPPPAIVMRLPTPSHAAGSAPISFPAPYYHTVTASLPQHEDWSSLIGIVTAICGNVLISIALNTQRYAHIKLNEQYAERQRLLKQAQRRATAQQRGYGTQENSRLKETSQREVSGNGPAGEERVRHRTNGRSLDEEDSSENEPLLSSVYAEQEALSEEADDPIPEDIAQKHYLKSPWWWAGIILMTVGEAGNFLAYGFAPASIVSPLGVVALISNCIIAPFFLKERFRKRDLAGVAIAVAGAVTVVLSASDSNPKLGPKEVWKLITRWEFETYLGITSGLILALMWASSRYGGKSIFIDIGLVGLFGKSNQNFIDSLADIKTGGYTALSTKGVASMLSYTLLRALTFPVTYLLVAVLVFTAIMQIKYVNRALKRFDATQVIPTQFVIFTLSVIIGSAVLYRDFEKESGEDAGKFVGGCAMTFLGVYLITSARERPSDEEEGFEEDDEDAIILRPGETYRDIAGLDGNDLRRQSSLPTSILEEDEPETDRNGSVFTHHDATNSLPELNAPATPTKTRDHRPTIISSSTYAQPSPMAMPSSSAERIWTAPEDQSTSARRSMQKLLRPLSKIFPNQDSQSLPHTLKATHSAPMLPTEAQFSRPQTPPSNPSVEGTTPTTPITPYTQDGSHLLSRHSIADLIPGPFTSTLSSPLSAIVADSLRRGVDVSSLKPRRRKRLPAMPQRSGLRPRGNSEADARVGAHADGSSSSIPTNGSEQESHDENRNLGRSLSNTVGDFFRNIKRSRRASQTDSAGLSAPATPSGEAGYFN